MTVVVNGLRDDFFPGPALAHDHDGAVSVRDFLDQFIHDLHGWTVAHEVFEAVFVADCGVEPVVLYFQVPKLKGALNAHFHRFPHTDIVIDY